MWLLNVRSESKGPTPADFVNLLITRDVHKILPNMQARYVILCNQYGGIINDPVLLRVDDDEFWFSISDSDVLLWAQGVNSFAKFNVDIHEIDVSPVQIQGPKSVLLMEKMFGPYVRDIPYYGLVHDTLNGHKVTISREPDSLPRSASRSISTTPRYTPTMFGPSFSNRARSSTSA